MGDQRPATIWRLTKSIKFSSPAFNGQQSTTTTTMASNSNKIYNSCSQFSILDLISSGSIWAVNFKLLGDAQSDIIKGFT